MITQTCVSPQTFSPAPVVPLQSKLVKQRESVSIKPIGSSSLPSPNFANGLIKAVKKSGQAPVINSSSDLACVNSSKFSKRVPLSRTRSTKSSQEVLFKGISEILCFLHTSTVFRTAGLFSVPCSEKKINEIEDLLLEGQKIPKTTSLKVVCGVLQKFLGKIDFPRSFTDGLLRASLSSFECDELVRQEITGFDDYKYFVLLEKVMFFLAKVESCSSTNNTTAASLSSLFGPLLIKEIDPIQYENAVLVIGCNELAANAFRSLLNYYIDRLTKNRAKSLADFAERDSSSR